MRMVCKHVHMLILLILTCSTGVAGDYGSLQFTGGMTVGFCQPDGDCSGTVYEFPVKVALDNMEDRGTLVIYHGHILKPHPDFQDDFSVYYYAQKLIIKESGRTVYYFGAGLKDNTTPDKPNLITVNTNWWLENPSDMDRSPMEASYYREIKHGDKLFTWATIRIGKFRSIYNSLEGSKTSPAVMPGVESSALLSSEK